MLIAPKPHRVQLSRKKGWRMPENTVSVARPGRWGNPFVIGETYPVIEGELGGSVIGQHRIEDRTDAVEAYRSWSWETIELDHLLELRGKNLACWCPLDQPCHADVLLELANGPEGDSC